jgi:hypothetical protein
MIIDCAKESPEITFHAYIQQHIKRPSRNPLARSTVYKPNSDGIVT